MVEARYYRNEGDKVLCLLCPRKCLLGENQQGFCRVREAHGGRLYSKIYGLCAAIAVDPIEKKPLYHFFPGSKILSLGTAGCNLDCRYCQNWRLVKSEIQTLTPITPEGVKKLYLLQQDSIGVAYTYNEPIVWFEFITETAPLIREAGGVNVMVTNGQIEPEPLHELLPMIDAFNIDVKSFSGDSFRRLTGGGKLEATLKTVEAAVSKTHVELTYLVVPGENDDPAEIEGFSRWAAGLNKNIPVHFSRYFPNYRMKKAPTPEKIMYRVRETASSYLNYVYLGNMPRGSAPENT